MDNVSALIFCNFIVWGDIQWFWSINFNALFSKNTVSGEVKRWGDYIEQNERCKGAAYNNVVLYNNKVIAVPGAERKIMIFDIEAKTFRYIDLGMRFIEKNQNAFFPYVVSGRWLFIIGNEIPYIIKFDMESENISGIINLSHCFTNREVYFRDAVLDKDKLIVPSMMDNLVFEIDTETLQWTKRKIGSSMDGFSAICKDRDSIWLVPRQQGAILQWYRENNEILFHEIEKAGFKYTPMKTNFHSVHYIEKRVWVFPFNGNMVFSIDLETGEVSRENAISRYLNATLSGSAECVMRAVQIEGEYIFLLCCCMGEWVQLVYEPATDKLTVSKFIYKIPYEDYLEYVNNKDINIISEADIPLENFVRYIVAHNNKEKVYDLAENNIGYQIWKTIN